MGWGGWGGIDKRKAGSETQFQKYEGSRIDTIPQNEYNGEQFPVAHGGGGFSDVPQRNWEVDFVDRPQQDAGGIR